MFTSLATGWYLRVNNTSGGVAGPFKSHSEAYGMRDDAIRDRRNQRTATIAAITSHNAFVDLDIGDVSTEVSLPRFLRAGQTWPVEELVPA